MYTKEELLIQLTIALHPEIKKAQRQELARKRNATTTLPPPTEAILHWTECSLKWLSGDPANRHFLTPGDDLYPRMLFDLKDPPLILFCEGNLNLLVAHCVGMVGSRSPSRLGLKLGHDFAHELGLTGWCIVSGLAEGIDGACHRGALSASTPTIAVLGGAIDKIYPKVHLGLAEQICKSNGLILSEYPPGTSPRPAFFPQRNRIIAALSEGTLVVEAAKRSGSLITARVASELGRTVMALPGSIHSPQSKGCHEMIKQGALLVETAQEIDAELRSTLDPSKLVGVQKRQSERTDSIAESAASLPDDWRHLLEHLTASPQHLDELAKSAKIHVEQALGYLTEMELDGWVVNEPGNRWIKVKAA